MNISYNELKNLVLNVIGEHSGSGMAYITAQEIFIRLKASKALTESDKEELSPSLGTTDIKHNVHAILHEFREDGLIISVGRDKNKLTSDGQLAASLGSVEAFKNAITAFDLQEKIKTLKL